MSKRNTLSPKFLQCKKRKIEINFEGGCVSGDAGTLLVKGVDHKMRLTADIAQNLSDSRRRKSCHHRVVSMLRQRVYAMACGYEDLNDHDSLRTDIALQTAVGCDRKLASSPTLSRFENSVAWQDLVNIQKVIVEKFIESFNEPPEELILDFDSTADRVHGEQDGKHYHRLYDDHIFLPLYVFCGDQLLISYLREGWAQCHYHAGAILRLLVNRLRRQWPEVKIIFRADAGFSKGMIYSWCERNNVGYIVGTQSYAPYKKQAESALEKAQSKYEKTGNKSFHYNSFRYGRNGKWKKDRRILVKAECDGFGPSARFVVTNLKGSAFELYTRMYNPRGDMENRIKEQKNYLFSDRTSSSDWCANQLRVLISSLSYVLLSHLRRNYLQKTEFAKAQICTLRNKLLKVGAVITRNTRRICFRCSSAFPNQKIFCDLIRTLSLP